MFFTLFWLCLARAVASSLIRSDQCGDEYGCFYDCVDTGCDFIIYWRHLPELNMTEFSINKQIYNIFQTEWIAIALSYDRNMGQDSVIECTTVYMDYTEADVRHSYNEGHQNVPVFNSKVGLSNISGQVVDGVLTCNFTRNLTIQWYDHIYDIDRPWYLLVASGRMRYNTKIKHTSEPLISPHRIDFREHEDVSGRQVYYLVKLHGCLMLFSWMIAASIGVVISRYFKLAWPHSKICGKPAWYQIHRMLMITVVVCVTAAFVLIWYDVGKYSELRGASTFQRSHPVLGVVIMGLTILNPIMAFLRPATGTISRPVFKYAHGFIGTTLYLLAVLNVALGTTLKKVDTSSYTRWVVVTFGAYQFLVEVILEIHNGYLIKTGQMAAYEMKQTSPVEDSITSLHLEPPGMVFKKTLLAFHTVIAIGIGTTCIVLVAW